MKKSMLLTMAAMIILPGAALAGGREGGWKGGSSSYSGAIAAASATSISSAAVRSTNINHNVAYGGTGFGGSANATGGSSTVINAVGGGGHGAWWQGVSPTVIAPGLPSNGTCADAVSFGVAFGPAGLSFGVPSPNNDCNIREDVKMVYAMRHRAAAWRVMCLSPRLQQAGVCIDP